MAFHVFHRTWWRANPDWPGGLEPEAGPKTTIARNIATAERAREICAEWNAAHDPGRLSDKAEFERQAPHVRRSRHA